MKKKYLIFIFICLYVISIDQWTKYVVEERLPLYVKIEVIPGFFNLIHVRNTGGAFGIFGGEREGLYSSLFVIISIIAIVILTLMFLRFKRENEMVYFPFFLIIGGAIGNLIDRIRLGEVIDFLDFYIFSFHWPAFNISDSAITLGIILLAYTLLFKKFPTQG